jgi:hypothetical protein
MCKIFHTIGARTFESSERTTSKAAQSSKGVHVAKLSPVDVPHLDVNDLQERCMLHPNWASVFRPTLTQLLYTSLKPFDDFRVQSGEFLDTVSTLFHFGLSTCPVHIAAQWQLGEDST